MPVRLALAGCMTLAGMALAFSGGWGGVAGVLVTAAAVGITLRAALQALGPAPQTQEAGPATASPRRTPAPAAAGRASNVMVEQVVPVWSRQIEVTRDAASDGLSSILNVFAEMNGALDSLVQLLGNGGSSVATGAVQGAVQREADALRTLTAASRRAFDERDKMVTALGACSESLVRQQRLVLRVREFAKHARLVAFNASIEANRGRGSGGGGAGQDGSMAVATELRTLSGQIGETAELMDRELRQASAAVRQEHIAGAVGETSDTALQMEIELHARAALQGLLGTLGSSLSASTDVQQASATLREQFDQAFVHFQFGDRVSQMLSIMANDMNNLVQWVATHPPATHADAAAWLQALEASYTMDEQRSHHHGNVHIDRDTTVEFF